VVRAFWKHTTRPASVNQGTARRSAAEQRVARWTRGPASPPRPRNTMCTEVRARRHLCCPPNHSDRPDRLAEPWSLHLTENLARAMVPFFCLPCKEWSLERTASQRIGNRPSYHRRPLGILSATRLERGLTTSLRKGAVLCMSIVLSRPGAAGPPPCRTRLTKTAPPKTRSARRSLATLPYMVLR
jgi:hypothetical protein